MRDEAQDLAGSRNTSNGPTQQASRDALLRDGSALATFLAARLPQPAAIHPRGCSRPVPAAPRQCSPHIYARDGAPYLLFTRRSSDLPVHRGEISFPGGSREVGDASLVETALRETHEELAIEPALVTVLGQLPPMLATISNFYIAPIVGWLPEGLPPLLPNAREVAEVIEAPLAALADPAIFHSEQWNRGGQSHTVYFYDLGAYRIWGVTGAILRTLLEVLPPPQVETGGAR